MVPLQTPQSSHHGGALGTPDNRSRNLHRCNPHHNVIARGTVPIIAKEFQAEPDHWGRQHNRSVLRCTGRTLSNYRCPWALPLITQAVPGRAPGTPRTINGSPTQTQAPFRYRSRCRVPIIWEVPGMAGPFGTPLQSSGSPTHWQSTVQASFTVPASRRHCRRYPEPPASSRNALAIEHRA